MVKPWLRIVCGTVLALVALAALACEVEYKKQAFDGGWTLFAVGICEAKEGRDPERTCNEAQMCTQYCCECENGTQYTSAVCWKDDGCADFGQACEKAESEACR